MSETQNHRPVNLGPPSESEVVRDERAKGFFWEDNEIVRVYGPIIGPVGLAVYSCLCMHADNSRRVRISYPSHATIAREIGSSKSTVKRRIAVMVEWSIIALVQRRSAGGDDDSSLKVLLPKDQWKPVPKTPENTPDVSPDMSDDEILNALGRGQGGFRVNLPVPDQNQGKSKSSRGVGSHNTQSEFPVNPKQEPIDKNQLEQESSTNSATSRASLSPDGVAVDDENSTKLNEVQSASPTAQAPQTKAATSKPKAERKTRTRDLAPTLESLDSDERRDAAKLVFDAGYGVALGKAVELARDFEPKILRQQVEWMPGAIADEEAKGKEVGNPAGFLYWRICNIAGRPRSTERIEAAAAQQAATAAQQEREAAARRETADVLRGLSDEQRDALTKAVQERLAKRFPGSAFPQSSSTFTGTRETMLLEPQTRDWLATVEAKKRAKRGSPVSVTTSDAAPVAVATGKAWKPTKAREPHLASLASEIMWDIEDGLLKPDDVAARIAELSDVDDNERDYVLGIVNSQLEIRKAA